MYRVFPIWTILSMKKYVENKEEYFSHRARLSLANSRLERREYLPSYSMWRNAENVEIIINL